MMRKVFLMLCSSALVSAGIIGTDYSPATAISYSSLPTPTIIKTGHIIDKSVTTPIGYTKFFQSPDDTQQSTFSKSFDTKSSKDGIALANTIPGIYSTGFHEPLVYHPQTTYTYTSPLVHSPTLSRSISVPVTYTTHNVPLTKTIVAPRLTSYTTPVISHSKLVSSALSSYSTPVHTLSSPTFTKSVSLPVTYTTHEVPLTKTVTSYTTPVISKTKHVSSGLSSYSSHTPIIEAQPIKTTLPYSEAPIVSHMSFSGLGANYSW